MISAVMIMINIPAMIMITIPITFIPRVTGSRSALRVLLPVPGLIKFLWLFFLPVNKNLFPFPDWVYTLLPLQEIKTMTFNITPVFFNIGINEQVFVKSQT